MNNEQQKIIEMYRIVNMHEANPADKHFLMPNPYNAILVPHLQMPGGWSVHFVRICLMMQLGYRLPLLWCRSVTWALRKRTYSIYCNIHATIACGSGVLLWEYPVAIRSTNKTFLMALTIPFPKELFGIEGMHQERVKKTNASNQ